MGLALQWILSTYVRVVESWQTEVKKTTALAFGGVKKDHKPTKVHKALPDKGALKTNHSYFVGRSVKSDSGE